MNQQNNNQAVVPRRSGRLAKIIPVSHWISLGYSEVGAQSRLNLQLDMKKYCDSKDNDTIIKLIPRDSKGDIYLRGYVLLHHELMLPHWQRFGSSLCGRTAVERIEFSGISLPVSV